MIKIRNLKKSYTANLILEISDLTLADGLFWVKGLNGSGKSTLLKIIAGIIPFEGDVEINSINLHKNPTEYRRLVNYVEAEPLYPPFLAGSNLISFFNKTRDGTKAESDKLISQFGISSFIKNPIGTYSSGMIKKLSLVLAFIGSPAYILLDEPLVTIDKESVPILFELIKEFSGKKVNFLFTSHQAFDLTDLVISELEVKNQQVCFL